MLRKSAFDRKIEQLTITAIEESLKTIALVFQAKWGPKERAK